MNIVVAFSFIDENAQMIESTFHNAFILHIDKTNITKEDQWNLHGDIEIFLRCMHDPKERLSHGLFNSFKKSFTQVSLKMSEPNNDGVLLRAIRELEDSHF